MASVAVTSKGGRCVDGSRAASQLVYGDYIISTSPSDGYSGSYYPRIGIWNRVTDTYKTFTHLNLTVVDRCVQPVEMDGDPWIVWWPGGTSDASGKAVRIDPSTAEILETITLSYANHPMVSVALDLHRATWEYDGLRWSLRGKGADGPCGWTYGTTAVNITPPIGGYPIAFFRNGPDLWTYHGSSYGIARYNLNTLSVVDSWSNPFGVLGHYPEQFVIIDGVFYAPKNAVGVIKWVPGSPATLIPNTSTVGLSFITVGADDQLIEVEHDYVKVVNPYDGAGVLHAPFVGMPAGRWFWAGGEWPLTVDGESWYPLGGP